MMLPAWQNYLSGYSPFTCFQVPKTAFSSCQDRVHFIYLYRLCTAKRYQSKDWMFAEIPHCTNSSTQRKGSYFFFIRTPLALPPIKRCLPKGSDFYNSSAQMRYFFLLCAKTPNRLAGSWKWYCTIHHSQDFLLQMSSSSLRALYQPGV